MWNRTTRKEVMDIMKYIRTKDGRIAEIKKNMVVRVCDDATRLVYKDRPYSCVLTGDDDIFKQADTIEELCDRFVVDFENGEEPVAFKNYLDTLNYFGKAKIYGAIWTSKGLIYVAKMNDKGTLELL